MSQNHAGEVTEPPRNAEKVTRGKDNRRKARTRHRRKKIGSFRPYPRVPLEKALLVAKAIKEKNGGNPWPAQQVAQVIGLSPKNRAFIYYLLSSKRFGLTEGTNADGQVSLAALGRAILYSGTPEEEIAAKRKSFLTVDIFRSVLDYYKGSRLPEMQYLGNTLQTKFKLPPKYHEEFSRLFRENCKFVGLESGIEPQTSAETALQKETGQQLSKVIVLGEPKTKTGLTCFVIMPFTEKTGQYPKGFFEEVLNTLIIPAAREAGFEVKTANRQGTEIIHSTIVNEILDADMCLCDLTEHNPNALFELGMRLAHDKPVALIHAEGTARVFDVDNVLRVLPYKKELWRTTLQKDIPELTTHIKASWDNRETNESYLKVLRGSKGN
jgi:hypothetical protein